MKIVCAPDSYKESLSAVDAATAMSAGILATLPDAVIDRCPVGDGGEGSLASLLAARPGEPVTETILGAMGDATDAVFGLLDDGRLAWVESAAAIGLAGVPAGRRDVMSASSFGVGQLLLAAMARRPARIVVGVGGSATNDGGCGMAQALGVRFYDADGVPVGKPFAGGALCRVAAIDAGRRIDIRVPIEVAVDVRNPLTGPDGAACIYGPQKGAAPDEVRMLDDGLARLAEIVRRDLGVDIEHASGAGAAGGLAAGLVVFAGARIVSGVNTVLDAVGFRERLRGADLCLTGEGRLDEQSLSGKTCIGVAAAAAAAGVPVVALVGSSGPGAERALRAGISEYVVIGDGLTVAESIHNARSLLADAAGAVVTRYAR